MARPQSSAKRVPRIHGIHLLRAVAVTAVVVYHFFPNALRGGFLGVDVFFVISGFLITGIIRSTSDRADFLKEFYLRRIKRLVPALIAVLISVAVASEFLLTDYQQSNLAKSTASSLIFAANIYFSFNTGYFDPDVYTRPLLHLWSLGVEEQFYLLWPAFLILLGRLTTRMTWWLIMILVTGALASEYFATVNAQFAFFWTPARIFQFCAGAVVYEVFNTNQSAIPRSLLFRYGLLLTGLSAISISFFVFTESMPMPGWRAFFPSFGAALVIYACLDRRIDGMKWLQASPIKWLGNISYSMYLWHWPVAVYSYIYFDDQLPENATRLALIAFTALLATLTFYLIEKPCIETKKTKPVLSFAGVLAMSLITYGCFTGLFSPQREDLSEATCETHPSLKSREHCYFKPVKPDAGTTVIWGDSHAGHLRQIAKHLATKTGRGAIVYKVCLPIPDAKTIFVDNAKNPSKATEECAQSTNLLVEAIANDTSIDIVWLSGGWLYLGDVHAQGKLAAEPKSTIAQEGIKRSIERVTDAGVTLHLLSQFPYGFTAYKCVAEGGTDIDDSCKFNSRSEVDHKFVGRSLWLREISRQTEVQLHDLTESFCESDTCPTILNGEFLYRDSNHIRVDLKPKTVDMLIERLQLERLFSE